MRLDLYSQLEGVKKSPSDPTLILINGLFADLSSFDGASLYVREKFQFLRYDCRGQGKSPKPESIYHLEDHVLDLEGLIEKHNLENIVLIGLSNGGRIAMEYARRNPKNIKGVVVCDTFDNPTPMIKAKLSSWLSAYEIGGGLHRFDVATPWIWGEEVFNEKSEFLLSYREKAKDVEAHVVSGLILGAMQTPIEIAEISCPMLFVVGREDLLTPPFMMEKMYKKAKHGAFCLAEGGHASLIERPTIMDKNIVPWIEKL